MSSLDLFNTRRTLKTPSGTYTIYSLRALQAAGKVEIDRLPFSLRVLLEAALRHCNDREVTAQDVLNLAGWQPQASERPAMPFIPGRVLLQDLTGVPVIADLAALRGAMARLGGDPRKIAPLIPVDLVVDHSVQVDYYGTADAFQRNAQLEFDRNLERYEFLHWAQKAFQNLRVVPPATGIVHQVNLEFLSPAVLTQNTDGETLAYPDTLVGTDSHTPMINGLGVVGWGVGGIEAIAAMLGQPIELLVPEVIGVKLTGQLRDGVTPMDLTLTITQLLRKQGVVDKFVEFFGPGLAALPLADRAMIANMSPENGATITFFPIDEQTLDYLRLSGRSAEQVALVEAYCKEQLLFRSAGTPDPQYSTVVTLDMSTVEPSLAGPKRPQDRVPLRLMKSEFRRSLGLPKTERGFAVAPADMDKAATLKRHGSDVTLRHGAVVIAAITSCTNTSNPFVLMAAGLLAKKAVQLGLKTRPYVKTSLAPGSRVVTSYLEKAGLLEPLADLGFNLVGYGCTTCIGNSGQLDSDVAQAVTDSGLVAAAVLSGNRNFEGRIIPQAQANYLASPPLVVAYALAGSVDLDLASEPLGTGKDGKPVFLRDIWPSNAEVNQAIATGIDPEMYRSNYSAVFTINQAWNAIQSSDSLAYPWDPASTYLQEPPFFQSMSTEVPPLADIRSARALAVFGDSITTDHISPASSIPSNSPAGKYLIENGVKPSEFNTYGARRGNDRVMARGTFANIRIKNLMLGGLEGGYTRHYPSGEQMFIYDAAMRYKQENVPLIVLAGKEYGTGSSRDWAAKGPFLQGVKAVIAESFERIHRSNLVGMGVLPMQFLPGENAASLGLTGSELFEIHGIAAGLKPGGTLQVTAVRADGSRITFQAIARLNTDLEVDYYRNNGILQTVLYNLLKQ